MSAPDASTRVLRRGLWVAALAFGLCFSLVPLYRIACEQLFGVKLGGPLSPSPVIDDETVSDRPEIGVGEEATPAALPSAIGLVWRALVLWVILLAVVGLAAWVGI